MKIIGTISVANKLASLSIAIYLLACSLQAIAFAERPYNQRYDPFRNPFIDYEQAKHDAATSRKLVLIDVGGDWCIWCKRLDRFLQKHDDIVKSLDAAFIVIKVNISEEQSNLDFFKQFPPIKGYPHFIIVDGKGKLLGEQDTSKLELGEGYSPARFKAFVDRWHAPKH